MKKQAIKQEYTICITVGSNENSGGHHIGRNRDASRSRASQYVSWSHMNALYIQNLKKKMTDGYAEAEGPRHWVYVPLAHRI